MKTRRSVLVRTVAAVTTAAAGTAFAAAPALALGASVPSSAVSSWDTAPSSTIPLSLSTGFDQSRRGELVSSDLIRSLSRREAVAELDDAGFDSGAVHSGVTLYRLVYRTVDQRGRPTTASGLLVIPRPSDAKALKVASYAHGTMVFRGDAPSVTDDRWTTTAPIEFAAAGFAAIAPDYLGLGLGPGPHPWMDVPSEVTASADLLRAAKVFVAGSGRTLDRDVLVTGFSQGASAALGLAKALQNNAVPGFGLAAAAPISGAYDLRRTEIPALLNGDLDQRWSVAYTALLFVSWDRQHGLYGNPADVFRAPYDRTLPVLLDGDHPGEQVLAGLPESVDKLLTDHGRDLLSHPNLALINAFRTTDRTCTDWSPEAPVRLYATRTDEQAAFGNTLVCQEQFAARGRRIPVVDVGNTDHGDSNVRATGRIVRWFSTLTRSDSADQTPDPADQTPDSEGSNPRATASTRL